VHNSTLIWYFILICNFALVNGADVPETVHRESIMLKVVILKKILINQVLLLKTNPSIII
jgi:hypothetical protein